MDNQRLFLYVALVFVLFMIWKQWERAHQPPPQATHVATTAPAAVNGAPSVSTSNAGTTKSGSSAGAPAGVSNTAAAALQSAQTIHVTTDLLAVDINTFGGDIRKLGLRKYPATLRNKNIPYYLLNNATGKLFVAQSGLIGLGKDYPYHRTIYKATQTSYRLAQGQKVLNVDLHWRSPTGVDYIKRFVFHRNSYVVRVEFLVTNHTHAKWQGYFYGQLLRAAPPEHHHLFALPTVTGGAIYTPEDHYQKIKFKTMRESPLHRDVTGGWAAMLERYFVGSWMPENQKTKGELYTRSLGEEQFIIGYKQTSPTTVAAGQTGALGMDLYAGPTAQERLAKLAPGMDRTVDYGMLTFIAAPLFSLLKFIHGVVGNWGWAIVVLTILLRVVFFPFYNASYKSMAKMKKVGPRLKALKERHGADKERYNREMMELYKKEKINPMGGCLPMVIPIPFFFALYWILLQSVELRQAPFVLWIHDLSAPDPYFVLPILMGITMFLTMLMSPSTGTDPMQRRIFMVMPIGMTVLFLFFPAGLVLYYLVTNALQVGQQWLITRSMEKSAT